MILNCNPKRLLKLDHIVAPPLVILLLVLSCKSHEEIRALSNSGQCKDAVNSYSEFRELDQTGKDINKGARYLTPLAASTGVAVTETTVYLGGGIAIGTLLCAPIAGIEVAVQSTGSTSARCFIEVSGKAIGHLVNEGNYKYTKASWKNLEKLRIVNYDDISETIRLNALCFFKQGDKENLEYSQRQIKQIKRKSGIWEYLSDQEKAKVYDLENSISLALLKYKEENRKINVQAQLFSAQN